MGKRHVVVGFGVCAMVTLGFLLVSWIRLLDKVHLATITVVVSTRASEDGDDYVVIKKEGKRPAAAASETPVPSVSQSPSPTPSPAKTSPYPRKPATETRGDVHIFYYPWYGNKETDGTYKHWDHPVLPHWTDEVNKKYPIGQKHNPPDDIGSSFYPELGCYSSSEDQTLRRHFAMIRDAGINVIVVSWWGQKGTDGQGATSHLLLPKIFDAARSVGVYIALHMEPYPERSAMSIREDIMYVIEQFNEDKALYRGPDGRLVFYIYDSYLVDTNAWTAVLGHMGQYSIRETMYDATILGLYLDNQSTTHIERGGFDGCYTYFAATGFTPGSTPASWAWAAEWAKNANVLFVPSVGPGYDDAQVRPWNEGNLRPREEGQYYKRMWAAAQAVKPKIISITSFNEWHEGTQIEPAVPKARGKENYRDYAPNTPGYYMDLTKELVAGLRAERANQTAKA